MNSIDGIIILLYFIAVLAIGFRASRAKSLKEYTTAGKEQKSLLILAITICATSVGGGTIFGISQKAFAGNLAYTYAALLTMPIDILIAIFIVPRISRYHGSVSVGDITAQFYGNLGRIVTSIATILVCFGYTAAQINVSGRILHYILGISYVQGVCISYIVTVISIFAGGFRAVIATSIIQFLAMIIGIPLLAAINMANIDIPQFISSLPANKVSIFSPSVLQDTILLTISFAVVGLYPSTIQRCLISDKRVTRSAIFIKAVFYATFVVIITLSGLLAHYLYPNAASSIALCHMIDNTVPAGLKGLVLSGILSATMSTASVELNIASISIVHDLLRPAEKRSSRQALRIAQCSVVGLGGLAIILALRFESVIDLVLFIAGFWLPVMLVPICAALYTVRVSRTGFISCIAAGISAFSYWHYFHSDLMLKPVFIGVMANLFVFSAFYLVERKVKREAKAI